MRRSLETIALFALALTVWITYRALAGPVRLPDRIPVHFDAAGAANGWGSPSILLLLPVIALAIYLMLTVVSLFPVTFNYSVRATEQNRGELQRIVQRMLLWMKTELVCLFAVLQWAIIEAARSGQGHLFPWVVPPFLVLLFGTVGWYIVAMFRASFGSRVRP
ncbi:MAG TPA: DUF1648 domain-containing protein [Terracidiphilus sp.]|nr:DUF1648 domain-containing protein [Terracidiphilus sp.]